MVFEQSPIQMNMLAKMDFLYLLFFMAVLFFKEDKISLSEIICKTPNNEKSMLRELAYEHAKRRTPHRNRFHLTLWPLLHLPKRSRRHSFWAFQIEFQKMLVTTYNNIHPCHNSGIQNGLILGV